MGMTVGGKRDDFICDPNVVPLIDVLLVLIIIFMVITPNVPMGLPTLVPQTPHETKPQTPTAGTIVVTVTRGGELLINQEPSNWNTLGTTLEEIFRERADKVAFVEGADEVEFAQVARAIDIMRGAGVTEVGLMPARDRVQQRLRPTIN